MNIEHSSNPENIEDDNQQEINKFLTLHEQAIKAEWKKTINKEHFPDDVEYNGKIDNCLVSEKMFAEKILLPVLEELKKTNSVVLLFDIDDTIARVEYNTDSPTTYIRPMLFKIFEHLKPYMTQKKISIGFLSSRREDMMKQQLDDPSALLLVKDFINQEHVYSSREINGDVAYGEYATYMTKNLSTITKDEVSEEYLENNDIFPCPGDLSKLICLQDIKQKLPNEQIIVVDDFQYPLLLDEKKGIRGVCVRDCMVPYSG